MTEVPRPTDDDPDRHRYPAGPQLRALRPEERAAAVELLTDAMADNPVHHAAFGADAGRRRRGVGRLFATMMTAFPDRPARCLVQDGQLLAVAVEAPAGTCQPGARQRLRCAPALLTLRPTAARDVSCWLAGWARQDPRTPHVHLGPLAVRPARQGSGLGGRLLAAHCSALDRTGQTGFLETDRPENVVLYQRHGYTVVDRVEVIGVPCWFMVRHPNQPDRGAASDQRGG